MALSVMVINYDFGHRRFSCWCTITTSDTDRLNSAREAKGPLIAWKLGDDPPLASAEDARRNGCPTGAGPIEGFQRQATFKSLKLSFVI